MILGTVAGVGSVPEPTGSGDCGNGRPERDEAAARVRAGHGRCGENVYGPQIAAVPGAGAESAASAGSR